MRAITVIVIVSVLILALVIVSLYHFQTNVAIHRFLLKLRTEHFTDASFRQTYPIVEPSKPIYVFYHICPKGDLWESIVDEQVSQLRSSGLYDKSERIYYGCSCPDCDALLMDKFQMLPKFQPLKKAIVPKCQTHENLTVNAMLEFSRDPTTDAYVLYMHSKGITQRSAMQQEWRRLMMHWMVGHHERCVDILRRGFYTVGTLVQITLMHYSGNFFWATSDYLRTLSPIIKLQNRLNAENLLLSKRVSGKHVQLTKITTLNNFRIVKFGFYQSNPNYHPADFYDDTDVLVF